MTWISVRTKLPADASNVLIAMADGTVWTGFLDGTVWRYVTSEPLDADLITHWMEMPAAPEREAA